MWACIASANTRTAVLFNSLQDVQAWLDQQPLSTIEQARVYRLTKESQVRLRINTLYVREDDA